MLERAGYEFEVMVADIDEKAIRRDDPRKLTLALAHAKADALAQKIHESALLVTSDQIVVWNGEIREKPEGPEQAREFLSGYAEHPAETVTAVVVTNVKTGKRREGVDVARVYFRPVPHDVIERFVASGDPFTHAGGFSIENRLLQPYIARIEGGEDSVIGLPLALLERLMQEVSENE